MLKILILLILILSINLSVSIKFFIKNGESWEQLAATNSVDDSNLVYQINLKKEENFEFMVVCNASFEDLPPRTYTVDITSDGTEEAILYRDYIHNRYEGKLPYHVDYCGYNLFPFLLTNQNALLNGDYIFNISRLGLCNFIDIQ
ncbi:hypothetical protein CYY_001108 [Polysphondylium violaceum]|uniref:Uncharacterized protein n=1 Tax=Polysphondylium violaceum TaxID=133409 RepID=A0A8J4V886_9MYCE|nr:hypothetical protein CYY_001108 [Polysphondylium violaceum]